MEIKLLWLHNIGEPQGTVFGPLFFVLNILIKQVTTELPKFQSHAPVPQEAVTRKCLRSPIVRRRQHAITCDYDRYQLMIMSVGTARGEGAGQGMTSAT